MIGVTEQAKVELKKILVDNDGFPQACLRIGADDDGKIGATVDIEMPGDQIVEYQGATVLVVDKELANKLGHVTIDVEDTADGRQLVIVGKIEQLTPTL